MKRFNIPWILLQRAAQTTCCSLYLSLLHAWLTGCLSDSVVGSTVEQAQIQLFSLGGILENGMGASSSYHFQNVQHIWISFFWQIFLFNSSIFFVDFSVEFQQIFRILVDFFVDFCIVIVDFQYIFCRILVDFQNSSRFLVDFLQNSSRFLVHFLQNSSRFLEFQQVKF